MDPALLEELIGVGKTIAFSKYFAQMTLGVLLWDYVLTFSDEVEYVWKKEKTWTFWLFVVVRYPTLLWKTWGTIASYWPGYTREACDRTVKLEGYFYVFILTLGLVFLTMRVYAVTKANKYVIIVSGILVASALATGLWFISIPSAKAIQLPQIPLDTFRACVITAPDMHEWAFRSQIVLADIIAFVCLAVFIFKLKAERGQSRMTRLMRTLFQDSVLYFLVMMAFHITMLIFTTTGTPSLLPPLLIEVLISVMISRLVISLRKTVDASLVQVWNRDHFTGAESGAHEMISFARPPRLSTPFSSFNFRNLKQSSFPDILSPSSEA